MSDLILTKENIDKLQEVYTRELTTFAANVRAQVRQFFKELNADEWTNQTMVLEDKLIKYLMNKGLLKTEDVATWRDPQLVASLNYSSFEQPLDKFRLILNRWNLDLTDTKVKCVFNFTLITIKGIDLQCESKELENTLYKLVDSIRSKTTRVELSLPEEGKKKINLEKDIQRISKITLEHTLSSEDLDLVKQLGEKITAPKDSSKEFYIFKCQYYSTLIVRLIDVNGYVAGIVRLDPKLGYIAGIAVTPKYQGLGLGEYLFKLALNNGGTNLICNGKRAFKLYHKYGFVVVKVHGKYMNSKENVEKLKNIGTYIDYIEMRLKSTLDKINLTYEPYVKEADEYIAKIIDSTYLHEEEKPKQEYIDESLYTHYNLPGNLRVRLKKKI